MNRFLLIALLVPAVKISAFYSHALLVQASKMSAFYIALIQRGQLHQSPHSLHRVLCQKYSNYTCILSNDHAIFCPYIIVRKYEPFFINSAAGASCQNFRVLPSCSHALFQRGQLRTATLASAFVSSTYASNTLTTHAYSVMITLYFVHTLLCVNMNRFLLIALLVPAVKISAFYLRAVTRCFNADNCVLLH